MTAQIHNTEGPLSELSTNVQRMRWDQHMVEVSNCDQVRRKIRRFLDNDGMTLKDFLKAINCSSNGYYRFMKQNGAHKGEGSDVYDSASDFFNKREQEGVPMPKKRRSTASAKDDRKPAKKGKASPGKETTDHDITQAELTDEEDDAVPVYSTCDEVRRQISQHLKKPNVTQTSFLRDLKAQYHTSKGPSRLTSSQLDRFRSKKGADSGNTSGVFYASYVFFEKLRRKEGKPKSEFRKGMEERWAGRGGFNTERVNQGFLCRADERPHQDEFGCVHIY